MASPLERSMKRLREAGCMVQKTETYNHFVHRRLDLFGFADALAVDPQGRGVLAINAMHLRHRNEHEKFYAMENLKTWLKAGNLFRMHQWAKRGPRGKRKIWELEVVEIVLDCEGNLCAVQNVELQKAG